MCISHPQIRDSQGQETFLRASAEYIYMYIIYIYIYIYILYICIYIYIYIYWGIGARVSVHILHSYYTIYAAFYYYRGILVW